MAITPISKITVKRIRGTDLRERTITDEDKTHEAGEQFRSVKDWAATVRYADTSEIVIDVGAGAYLAIPPNAELMTISAKRVVRD